MMRLFDVDCDFDDGCMIEGDACDFIFGGCIGTVVDRDLITDGIKVACFGVALLTLGVFVTLFGVFGGVTELVVDLTARETESRGYM